MMTRALVTSYDFSRGPVVIGVPNDISVVRPALRMLYNPIHIANPGAGGNRSALAYAKRKAEKAGAETLVYFVFPVSGVWEVALVPSSSSILSIFKSAGWRCRFALEWV